MPNDPFFGRQRELKLLQRLLSKRSASLVVLKGRRRIGKSRLAEEFGKNLKTYIFTGLPPEEELPIPVCNQFWLPYSDRVSAYEKFKILFATGCSVLCSLSIHFRTRCGGLCYYARV